MKKIIFIVLTLLAVLLILPLSFNNSHVVTVNYLVDSVNVPLSWVIFGALIAGVLLALPFFAVTGLVWKIRARGLEKQINNLLKSQQREAIAETFMQEKQK